MVKKYFLILFTIFILCSCVQREIESYFEQFDIRFGEDKTLEVMTWNLQHFPKNEITIKRVASAINELDVDVVGLQEIENQAAFNKLIGILNQFSPIWQGYRAVSDEWNQNLAFIYKANLEVEKIYEIYLDDKYDYALPRRPLVMEFKYEDEPVVVINNHFKASGGEENENRRRAAAKLIHEFIEEEYVEENVIVIGDLNDEISDSQNENVFWDFIENDDKYLFADLEIAADSTAKWSYPYWRHRGHIDHILITNELYDEFEAAGSIAETITLDEYLPDGWDQHYKEISDHRPVAIKLKF
ncbi:MAG: endonuclease/exonuclease/phosphatase family protein [Candidatus Cloacimonadota bacterium]|nr:endonuclease/exonuclease/phosphatase family protein [Candidatus Cloacimonadota bacterium]